MSDVPEGFEVRLDLVTDGLLDRVAASVPIRAKLGKPLGGAAPFGYRWENRELVPDQKEAPVRRRVYDLFLQHRRKKAVARLLNDEGLRTRNGSKFTDTAIERLIRDTTAKGTRRANYTKSTGDGKKWVFKPEADWVLTPVEPIVSEELWTQCNGLLDERRASGKPPAKRVAHLFAGIAFCECGTKMYIYAGYPKYTCQKCRTKIPADDLEAVFREQLKEFFLSSEDLSAYLEQADTQVTERREFLASLESERGGVQAEMDKIYKLYVSDQITGDGFGRTYKPLEVRLKALDDQLPKLQAELDFLRISNLSHDEIIAEAQDLYSRWTDLLPQEKRQIVENVVERVTISKDSVAIDLCYAPSAAERSVRNRGAVPCVSGLLGSSVSSEISTKRQRGHIPALPFCRARLSKNRIPAGYPNEINTLGDHLLKKRLDLRLTTKALAELLGVTEQTVSWWQRNVRTPSRSRIPKVMELIGCLPENWSK